MVPTLGSVLRGGPGIEGGIERLRRQGRSFSQAAGHQYPSVGERRTSMPGAGAKHVRRRQERPILLVDLHAPERAAGTHSTGDQNTPVRQRRGTSALARDLEWAGRGPMVRRDIGWLAKKRG